MREPVDGGGRLGQGQVVCRDGKKMVNKCFLPSDIVTISSCNIYIQHLILSRQPAIAHDIEGKPFVTGGVDDGEVTDSAEILDEGNQWLPYEHANVSPTEAYWL